MVKDKNEFFGLKNRENVKKLMKVINEVEDTAVKVKLGILTYEDMQQEKDILFQNKLERFQYLKEITRLFLYQILEPKDIILEPQDSNVEIIEHIFQFKRRYL